MQGFDDGTSGVSTAGPRAQAMPDIHNVHPASSRFKMMASVLNPPAAVDV